MTESAPAGTSAPVMIRTQEPADTRSGDAGPAATSPVTGSTTGASSLAETTTTGTVGCSSVKRIQSRSFLGRSRQGLSTS